MEYNCPGCGASLGVKLRYSKLAVCAHCRTSVFLDDEGARAAGKAAVLTQIPSIFSLGKRFVFRRLAFVPIGRVRYAHSRGVWEEWWAMGDDGGAYWVSVDEGDIAIESEYEPKNAVPPFTEITLGQALYFGEERASVTEKDAAVCEGFEGELPFAAAAGKRFDYVDLTAPSGHYSIEYHPDAVSCFKGSWVDPFEVKEA